MYITLWKFIHENLMMAQLVKNFRHPKAHCHCHAVYYPEPSDFSRYCLKPASMS